jgi:hypothetical protein
MLSSVDGDEFVLDSCWIDGFVRFGDESELMMMNLWWTVLELELELLEFLQVKMNVHALFILFLGFLVLWSENAEREKVQSVCDDVERNEWWFLTLTVELAFIADCVTAWTNNKLPCGAGPCNKLLDRWTNEKLTHVQTWWLGQKGLKYNFLGILGLKNKNKMN